MTVNQTVLGKGENEIVAAKRLIEDTEFSGKIIAGDAMFLNREIELLLTFSERLDFVKYKGFRQKTVAHYTMLFVIFDDGKLERTIKIYRF